MTSDYRSPGVPPPRGMTGRLARTMIFMGLVLIIGWLAWSAFRLVRAGQSLLAQQQRAESLLEAGILNADPQELKQILLTAREDILEIKSVVGPLTPAGPLFGWLPGIGPLAADAQGLLLMADAGTETAVHAFFALEPVLATNQDSEGVTLGSLPRLVAELGAAKPQLVQADQAAGRLFEAREMLDHEREYPARILSLLGRLDDNAALLNDGLKLAQIAPEMLGYDGPRTYLLMAQNEDELRPSGGFISGAGLLTVTQGQIVGLSFDNANLIDDWQSKPYGTPPPPYMEFMGMDIFLFRDANFWPDFARSAVEAMDLYSYGQDVSLDGVIAFDQQFLQSLLAVTGPLSVPELERTVDANSVVSQLREEWGPGGESENWILDRKAFMGPLANAFLSQINSGLLGSQSYELVGMLATAAEERHLQLFSAKPATADILDQTSWSGRLLPPDHGDFLHVADTNMGFNKVNAVVERSLNYDVKLDDAGDQVAQLKVHYHNPPAATDVECQHGTRYSPDTQYESLTTDCYWNYLRVYVPHGSSILWSSEHPVPADNLMSGKAWSGTSRTGDAGSESFTVFDNFLLVAPGQDVTVAFHYALPDNVIQRDGEWYNYSLTLRKQAGMEAENVSISITIPEGASLVDVAPRPASVKGDTLLFDLALESDVIIDVTYSK